MRFMMLVKATPKSEAGVLPDEAILAAMAKYNEELMKAGMLLDLSGLHPTSKGVRVRFSGGKTSVVDGPFTESKELVAGYWLIQAKSLQEALEWAKRAPMNAGNQSDVQAEIEIRQVYELEDFGQGDAVDHHQAIQTELTKKK